LITVTGAICEEDFERSFEDVPTLSVVVTVVYMFCFAV